MAGYIDYLEERLAAYQVVTVRMRPLVDDPRAQRRRGDGVHMGPEQCQGVLTALIVDAMRRTAAAPQLPPVRLLSLSERQHLRGRRRRQRLSRAAARRQVHGRPEEQRPVRSSQRPRQPGLRRAPGRLLSPRGRPEVPRPEHVPPRPRQQRLRGPVPNHLVSRPVAPWYFAGALNGGGAVLEEEDIGSVSSSDRHAWLAAPVRRTRYRSRRPLIRSPRLESVREEYEGPAPDMWGR